MNTNQPNRRPNPNRRPDQMNRRRKPKKNNTPIIIVIIVLIVIALGVAAYLVLGGKNSPPPSIGGTNGIGGNRPSFTSSIAYKDMLDSMTKASEEVNNDTVGWMIVPGTNINQEVVHYGSLNAPIEGEVGGNDYYIYRDNDKVNHPGMTENNWVETPFFTHWRNFFDALGSEEVARVNKNYVVFGHNWTNYKIPPVVGNTEGNTMFAQLPSYTDIDFATENPYIHFSTKDHHMVWKIFAVLYTEENWMDSIGTDFNYIEPDPTEEQFDIMIKEFNERSVLTYDTGITKDDTILTLSTCTRAIDGAGEQQRFVVVARMLRDGESDTDLVKITENTSHKEPIFK